MEGNQLFGYSALGIMEGQGWMLNDLPKLNNKFNKKCESEPQSTLILKEPCCSALPSKHYLEVGGWGVGHMGKCLSNRLIFHEIPSDNWLVFYRKNPLLWISFHKMSKKIPQIFNIFKFSKFSTTENHQNMVTLWKKINGKVGSIFGRNP